MPPTIGRVAAFATAMAAAPALADGPADPLAKHVWRSRVLVVLASGRSHPLLAAQRRMFEAAGSANRDRDLVLVEALGGTPEAKAIRRRLALADGGFRAILVGKDGGEKLASSRPIAAYRLHREIDRMPMRRTEMRGRPSR